LPREKVVPKINKKSYLIFIKVKKYHLSIFSITFLALIENQAVQMSKFSNWKVWNWCCLSSLLKWWLELKSLINEMFTSFPRIPIPTWAAVSIGTSFAPSPIARVTIYGSIFRTILTSSAFCFGVILLATTDKLLNSIQCSFFKTHISFLFFFLGMELKWLSIA